LIVCLFSQSTRQLIQSSIFYILTSAGPSGCAL